MASGGEFRNVIKAAVKFRRIPDKWKDYAACGKTIRGERLIAFKTPLAEKYHYTEGDDNAEDSLQQQEQFTPSDLFRKIRKNGEKLGLVVDFTNTKRYYEPQEITEQNVEYKKIKCEGKIVPPEKVVSRFKATILSFFKRFPTSKSLVGVHCTHGLNRAGYIVCRYLIDCKGYAPDQAIEAFNYARGYQMERKMYIEDLQTRKPSLISKMDIDDLIKVTTFSEDEQREECRYNDRRNGDENRGGGLSRPGGPWRERNASCKPYERRHPRDDDRRRAYDGMYENYGLPSRDYRHCRAEVDRYPPGTRSVNKRSHEDTRRTDWDNEDRGQQNERYQDSREHHGERKRRRNEDNYHGQARGNWQTDEYSRDDSYYSHRGDPYSHRGYSYSQNW